MESTDDRTPVEHIESTTNTRDAREFYGAVRGPDVKDAIRADPEKANKLAAGLAAWAKGVK